MLHNKRASFTGSGRKVSPPAPTAFTESQKGKPLTVQPMPPRSPPWKTRSSPAASASYLASLRNERPARPSGSRPPPFKTGTYVSSVHATLTRSDSAPLPQDPAELSQLPIDRPELTKPSSVPSSATHKGRPLAHAPTSSVSSTQSRNISPSTSLHSIDTTDSRYRESMHRKLEREESHALREALELIDSRDEEGKIYEAAQQEAADLVWKHRNPQAAEDEKSAPYFNPDIPSRKSYGSELGSGQAKSQRNASDSSYTSSGSRSAADIRHDSKPRDRTLSQALKDLQLASVERSKAIIATTRSERRRSSGMRHVSNGSSKGVFPNPDNQIYEEPEAVNSPRESKPDSALPLRSTTRNSILRGARPLPQKPGVTFALEKPRHNRIDIYKNPPSQSRNAGYTANNSRTSHEEARQDEEPPKSADGVEIRSDDIRAATSMKLKDRSAKLPKPVAVSDQLGRPIVSFDPAWKPPSDSPRASQDLARPVIKLTESPRSSKDIERPLPRPLPSTNQTVNSAPAVPTIQLPPETNVPTIHVDSGEAPSIAVSPPAINLSGPTVNVAAPEEGSTSSKPAPRPLPKHASTSPANMTSNKRLPWLRSGVPGAPTVSCSSCSLPISGRIVTASGSHNGSLKARFHPECFSCHHCQTNLECVAFFPEPDEHRQKRLDVEGIAEGSEDADIRFFCSLDYHEMFSPRCKSCKTPIEGEVIVAAGAEWHVGHFYCAECGDPFDSSTPFVEKDGYAYCVRCHTKRTSARCRECKQQILDELTVEALGGKWHEKCFKCYECEGSFGDEGRFFIRDVPVEPTDKEKRKGITSKMEEKAVCSACEERRLKA
ncbi:uncharacterized protein HMPREF1541_08869 [Cyphellophora europaea CBS 101466]|uniref:LIM zinc-binding domain-containing protein n=1 Tax=Cyphellophora europaea (strain CBS 101466) TaxID=1220924 RepID=W2RJE0_CYPE1|nr:uncharacterized protein HMPREF1541_08869 [Cyphellophora europaea CBS 101466]ETN36591.1 hypothetical protein HMPREF1541_08869 [Cyphellophora europaea CBS 101466]